MKYSCKLEVKDTNVSLMGSTVFVSFRVTSVELI